MYFLSRSAGLLLTNVDPQWKAWIDTVCWARQRVPVYVADRAASGRVKRPLR